MKFIQLQLVIIFVAISMSLSAQGIEFFHGTFDQALERAKTEEKIIFVDAYASWCGPCKKMAANVFTKPEVGEYFNKNFINLKIDMEKDEGPALDQKFNVTAYPTLLFIDPKGNIVTRSVGGMDVQSLLAFGEKGLSKMDFSSDLTKEYEKGNRSPDFILKYVTTLNKLGKSPLKIANDFLGKTPDVSTPDNLKIIAEAAVECDSRLFEMMIDNKESVIKLKGETYFEDKVLQASNNTVAKAVEFQMPEMVELAKTSVKKHVPAKSDLFGYEADMKYFKSVGQLSSYCKSCLEYAQKFLKEDGEKLNKLAVDLEKHHYANPDAMKSAEKLAQLSTKTAEKYEYQYTYARILERNGKLKQAIQAAKKSLTLTGENLGAKNTLDDYILQLEKNK